MKKDTKNWLIVGGVLAVLAYVLFRRQIQMLFAPVPGKGLVYEPPVPGVTVSEPRTVFNKSLILKRGSKGAEVSELQRLLKRDGQGSLLGSTGPNRDGIDGDFGVKTETALQKQKGVTQISLNDYEKNKSSNPVSAAILASGGSW